MTKLNILQVTENESFGDHGQTVTRAVDADLSLTLGELTDLYLTRGTYPYGERETNPDTYLVIRLTMPVPEIAPVSTEPIF